MKPIRDIFAYTTGLRGFLVVIALTSVVTAGANLVVPFIMKTATDWIVSIVAGNAAFAWPFLILLIGAFIITRIVEVIAGDVGGWFGDTMSMTTRRQLSSRYYSHLMTLPQKYYDGAVTGKVINRLSRAISDITQFLQFFSNNLLQMLLTMGITIIILAVYSWPLAVLFMLLIPANLYLTAKTSKKWQRLEAKKNHHFDIASGRFAEVIGQVRLLKSFVSEKRELKSFDTRLSKMLKINREQSQYWHVMNAWRGLLFGLIFAGIYGVLFYETATQAISVGTMVLLLTLVQQASFPLRNLSFFVDNYQRAVANSKDYIVAMQEQPESDESSAELSTKSATVKFDDITFAYEQKKQVIENVNFEVEQGSKVALVGESGGGKSTLANLLMRLYEPDSGSITIGGKSVADFSRQSVRRHIATVFQDAALFSGSIRENIAYANPEASDEQVRRAAKVANALKFIGEFPDGLNTEIGERGIKLSGGQKQRISIARAVLKDAPVLILDEATSALDSRAEHEVQEALERLMKGRTTLIIAHRLSTIAHVDKIVTLKNGKVDEVGSPQVLAKSGGIYAQLLDLQMATTESAKKRLKAYDMSA